MSEDLNLLSKNKMDFLLKSTLENIDACDIIGGKNPFNIAVNGFKYSIYMKNLSYTFTEGTSDDVLRIQLGRLRAFEPIISSDRVFVLLGYDSQNDVMVTWDPTWIKPRLNVKKNVSVYSRHSAQRGARNKCDFVRQVLNNNGEALIFPRELLADYLFHIDKYFPSVKKVSACTFINEGIEQDPQIDKDGKLVCINQPELLSAIRPYLVGEERNRLKAYEIIFDFYGDRFNDTMRLSDWGRLIDNIEW